MQELLGRRGKETRSAWVLAAAQGASSSQRRRRQRIEANQVRTSELELRFGQTVKEPFNPPVNRVPVSIVTAAFDVFTICHDCKSHCIKTRDRD
ncbi:hypothetical protein EYF80_025543 [Liparis tanakae]|uniref:Uncharacterized protein n=1 Tax=Liparis tanakae TaxID=230148 RepID=A0A4Z2HHH1_9TELE|nr:hypothetical protein EYF80_025543 [Liparis tanakae]